MKIRFLANAYENGMNYKIGDVADIEDKRAKQLVQVGVAEFFKKVKEIKHPPKDKIMRKYNRK